MEPVEGSVIGLRQPADDKDVQRGSLTGDGAQDPSSASGQNAAGGRKRIKKRTKLYTTREIFDENYARRRGENDTGSGELLYNEEADTEESQMGFEAIEGGSNAKLETMMKQILDRLKTMERNQQVNYENLTKRMIEVKSSHRDRDREHREGHSHSRATQRGSRISKFQEKAGDEEGENDNSQEILDESKMKLNEKEPIVPTISEHGFLKVADYWCERCLNSRRFDRVVGIVILCNCIEIGWSIETELRGESMTASKVFESLFLVIFILELCIRFAGSRSSWKKTLNNKWVQGDLILISLGVVCSWIIEPILENCSGDCSTSQTVERWIQLATVFRLFRLFRFLRALRFFRTFKTLWKLANGLVQSMGTMVWTLCLIVFILYVFACLCVELITRDPYLAVTLEETVEKHYSSIPLAMFSLIGFVTLDNASDLYWDIVMERNELALLFIPLMLVVSIALVNLVTAVLVENAIESARADKEYQKEIMKQKVNAVKPEIVEAFHIIDTSGDGEADLAEVLAAFAELPDVITEQVSEAGLKEVFELLDFDGTGTISEEEFVEGILQLTLSDQPIETKQMLKALSFIREDLHDLKLQIEKILPPKPDAANVAKLKTAASQLIKEAKAARNTNA